MESLASHPHLLVLLVNCARSTIWLAILFVVFAPLEHFLAVRPLELLEGVFHEPRLLLRVNSLLPIFLLGPASAPIALAIHATLPAGVTGAAAGIPLWARMVGAMVVLAFSEAIVRRLFVEALCAKTRALVAAMGATFSTQKPGQNVRFRVDLV